jgi:beta-lactamase
MRSPRLVTLLVSLTLGQLSVRAQLQPDSLQQEEIQTPVPHLLSPDSIPKSALLRIDSLAKWGITQGAYPGCQLFAFYRGEVIYDKAFGTLTSLTGAKSEPVTTHTLYDLASVTKAAATTPALMLLVAEGKVKLDAPLLSYLPETKESLLGMVTLRQLLHHQSGLPAGINFYTDLIDESSYEGSLIRYKYFAGGVPLVGKAWGNPNFSFREEYISDKPTEQHTLRFGQKKYLAPSFKDRMMERILLARVSSNKAYRYSDLNFILLQQVIERVTGEPLDRYVQERIYKPIRARLYFNPLEHGVKLHAIAPSQQDNFLRHEILRGTVDDEAAACLGGVSGNAGLFGSAGELAKVCQLLLQHGAWGEKQVIPTATVRLFTETNGAGGIRALGFDKPRSTGGPTGIYASSRTYGHLGFTGTCFWVDPEYDLVFVFLSNRTYPSRQNTTLIRERLRQRLQDLVYEAIGATTPR